MTRTVAFWHVYLTEDVGTWAGIVMEQLGVMERSGLFVKLDELNVTCIHRDWVQTQMFQGMLSSAFSSRKTFITFHSNPFNSDREMLENISSPHAMTEAETLYWVWIHSQIHDSRILYFHTKGITADMRFLQRQNYEEHKKYFYWRQMLNWGCLDQWGVCLAALDDGYDIVGPNFQTDPHPHYSGGFYWTKSSHVKKLPNPTEVRWWHDLQSNTKDVWLKSAPERFRNEMWITQTEDYNALCLAQGIDNPASKFVSTSEYWK